MSDIELTKEEKLLLVTKIREYFELELNQELGQFDAEFLLDFMARELGPFFYNRGLYDAQAIMQSRIDAVMESIYELEKFPDS
ncbi:MAG: DUF2164 domain-containing protein [Gammaproteobacteria bacterium]|nr:DUF2164 domain-containing protein [Pseudomonadales bacterium]MCP5347996.1 DUF2164 domain-containing protein [Pseudomonadales bacterium]